MPPTTPRLFGRGSWPEAGRIADVLRAETVGGALLAVAAVLALVWANSPWGAGYAALRDVRVGPGGAAPGPDARRTWAADGLLAIFFFVAGLELKREFVAGDLREPRRAALPVAAAVGGMVVPAAALRAGQPRRRAAATCAAGRSRPPPTSPSPSPCSRSIGTHLPAALRTFLLTLAVVDDLLAITSSRSSTPASLQRRLARCSPLVPLALFALLVQRRVRSWWLLLPLAVATWALVHASGVHATVAGVLLGLRRAGRPQRDGGTEAGRAWPSTSSTGCGRSRPASRCRCSRSSPPGSRSAGCGRARSARRPGRPRRRRRPGGRQDGRHPRLAPGCSPGSPAPSSTTT